MREAVHKSRVPPGGFWYYLDPDSRMTLQHPFLAQLEINAKKHRLANNFTITSSWNEFFENNACENTPGAECVERGLGRKAIQFAKAMRRWLLSGAPVVTEEEFNRRESVCKGCEHFSGNTGPFSIHCKLCGCSKKKLEMKTEGCPAMKW